MSVLADLPVVLSIMPAPGWVAVYDDGGCEPLVCWAVVEMRDGADRWREVRPLVVGDPPGCDAVAASDCTNLVRVEYRGADAASLYGRTDDVPGSP